MTKTITITIVAGFCLIIGCAFSNEERVSVPKDTQSQIWSATRQPFERPVGNELRIEVQFIAPDEYEIRINNISEKPVFCGYLPAESSNRADFFAFGVEWRSSEDQPFKPELHSGDYSPPAVAIEPSQLVRVSYFPKKSGQFRVTFGYAVDPEVAKLKNEIPFRERGDELNAKIDEAFAEAKSPIFKVNIGKDRKK